MVLFSSYLSQLKEKELKTDKKIAVTEANKLRDSWINPINTKYLYQKGDQFPNQKYESFTISIDQPVFKSGGIYRAIKYAISKRGESLISVKLKRNELIAAAIKNGYLLKRVDYQIEKQLLLIKNAKINVRVKKEAYLSGELDSTFLDNAIIEKNRLELALCDMRQSREDIYKNYRDLVDFNFTLPRFSLVKREEFFKKNLDISRLKMAKKAYREYKYMTISRYLPSLSLFGNYNYQNSQGSQFMPSFEYKDSFYTYGFHISMPLFDINSFKNIELAKLNYLKSSLQLLDKKREEKNLFRAIFKKLGHIDKKISLTYEDLKLYSSLLNQTKELFKAGEKTKYDVMTMQNSLNSRRLDLKIFDMDRQILLLELYKKMGFK